MVLCVVDRVSKRYAGDDGPLPVNDVSLSIEEGDFVSIGGESGGGKSKLLMMMGGLLAPSSGSIVFDGLSFDAATDRQLTEVRRTKIAYVFQSSRLVQALTVEENIRFAAKTAGVRVDQAELDRLVAEMGLQEKADVLPSRLSGGQRRRAMIAAALAQRSRLLLADEPTNDLDEHWAHEVMKAFTARANRGSAVVVVTHSDIAKDYATRFLSMSYGSLISA